MKPDFATPDGQVRLYHGDALAVLPCLPRNSIDQLVADPPYASGGRTIGEKRRSSAVKYNADIAKVYESFDGDHRDQRSWIAWMTLWLSQAAPVLAEGAYVHVFTDWRQLPGTTDAVQGAGLLWRGLIAWDKGGAARAGHKGYHRHQCEYLAWATRGPCIVREDAGPFPGCYRIAVDHREKLHPTAKPIELMEHVVAVSPAGGRVLDPFLGSGTTAIACINTKRAFTGIETNDHYFAVSVDRVRRALGLRRPCQVRRAA